MNTNTIPESIQKSELARALEKKLRSPQPVKFDYWGQFGLLRDTVSAQMGEMKILFPQFTPHDEAYHLARLFGVADKLLGSKRYDKMNTAELFLLACGLYAHDWGMSVGSEELNFLRSGAKGIIKDDVFTPLDDESERLRQFTKRQGIHAMDTEGFPPISDEQIRLYIRQTHAWRSGVRARSFFKSAGSSVPQALDKVCQGHWLSFSELDNEHCFSAHAGVLGHTVNLRAVALYVRLVDLFDISDDRTPYAIWRFVAPLDGVSQMEWNKHRALSPVTFPEHGDGRCVRFDGSTSDPEVWAELEDLRNYCDEQIKGTMDLMARHREERHQLDIRKLEWAVTAERFKPVNIRFEFHRQRMFEILADEIYQGDSHVFLRELLQNSIDAIRMRRELVQRRTTRGGSRRDVGLGFDDAIYFSVEHKEDGDAIVCCRDYGIGMDEYIVRNYLSIAGVSYYQSDEFKHLGLTMDPISRFGIGILSCFMVAQKIEIETCREPQEAEQMVPLRIVIPAVDRQFRVYPASKEIDIGTAVTVHVLGKKLKSDVHNATSADDSKKKIALQVTEYLSAVAGFVEFPIVIDENGQRTIILHPDRPQSLADLFRAEGLKHHVCQLSTEYGWNQLFAPQDVHVAQVHLKQHSFDLRRDLGIADYEGHVSYIRPVSDQMNIRRVHISDDLGFDEAMEVFNDEFGAATLRSKWTYGSYKWIAKEGIAPSSRTSFALSVYRNGILVSDAGAPDRVAQSSRSVVQWPIPALRVNLPKRLAGRLDVARRALLGTDDTWDKPIWDEVVNYLRTHEFDEAFGLEPSARLDRLGKLAHMFHLTDAEIVNLVSNEQWPFPMLISEQGATILSNQLTLGGIVRSTPNSLIKYIWAALGWETQHGIPDGNDFLSMWRGEKSIAIDSLYSDYSSTALWIKLSEWYLKRSLVPVGVRFLKPPYPGLPLMPQIEFRCVAPVNIRELDLMEKTMHDPLALNEGELCALRTTEGAYQIEQLLNVAPFSAPFESYFLGTDISSKISLFKDKQIRYQDIPYRVLNLRHPTTIALLRSIAAIRWHQRKKTQNPADIGKAADQLRLVAESILLWDGKLQARLDGLWAMIKQYSFIDFQEPPPLSSVDYMPVSDTSRLMCRALSPTSDEERAELWALTNPHLRCFGQVCEELVPEEAPFEIIKAMSGKV